MAQQRPRLTIFSKVLIVATVIGILAFAILQLRKPSVRNAIMPSEKEQEDVSGMMTKESNSGKATDLIKIGVVTWGGYAGGQYFNEGFNASEKSRFKKDYGFDVEFKVLDDFDASRAAFKADEVNLLWCTIDAFPTEVDALKEYDPQVVFQADWSRGGDAIVVRRGINSAQELKGKKIAVAPMTPSHTFLLWLLDAGGLSIKDVEIKEVPNAIDAATAFKTGSVDAAVVWSPDDEACIRSVNGSKILENTKTASNIIADVFIAKKSFVVTNRKKLEQLVEGWMKGASEINSSNINKEKASKILADGLNIPEADALQAINNVRLCTHGDNLNFYGLNTNYKGITGEDLYNKMGVIYNKLNYAPARIPNWREVANPSLIKAVTSLTSAEHQAEGAKTFKSSTPTAKTAPSIAAKMIKISFRTGEYLLDENAKYIIDNEFSDIARAFGNAKIRIEGNTDNTGNRASNVTLSRKRAKAAADFLTKEYSMDANRFIVVGNGPDKPVGDNKTKEGRAKNRRTEFHLVRD